PLADGEQDVHELLLANFFAQTKALAFGKTAEEVRAEGTEGALVAAREFSGDRPTTSIMAPALTPAVLGQLIALYQHITCVQGVGWRINSFDQWGVELGKQLAKGLAGAVGGDEQAIAAEASSTSALIRYYRSHRSRTRSPGPPPCSSSERGGGSRGSMEQCAGRTIFRLRGTNGSTATDPGRRRRIRRRHPADRAAGAAAQLPHRPTERGD